MTDGGIELQCFDHEDPSWHVELRVSNGAFTAAPDFYSGAEELSRLGRQLADFTGQPGREVRFEHGDRSGRFAHFVFLRVFSYDLAGHTALEFACSTFGQPPYRAEAGFSVLCEVAGINRLGEALCRWARQPEEPLSWEARSGEVRSA